MRGLNATGKGFRLDYVVWAGGWSACGSGTAAGGTAGGGCRPALWPPDGTAERPAKRESRGLGPRAGGSWWKLSRPRRVRRAVFQTQFEHEEGERFRPDDGYALRPGFFENGGKRRSQRVWMGMGLGGGGFVLCVKLCCSCGSSFYEFEVPKKWRSMEIPDCGARFRTPSVRALRARSSSARCRASVQPRASTALLPVGKDPSSCFRTRCRAARSEAVLVRSWDGSYRHGLPKQR